MLYIFAVNKKVPESGQYHRIYDALSGNRTDRNEIFINHANHGTIKISIEWNHIYIFRFKFCKEPRFILEIRIKFYWIAYKKLIGTTVIKSYEATCPLPSYSIEFFNPFILWSLLNLFFLSFIDTSFLHMFTLVS